MKRILFFLIPVILAALIFSVLVYYYSTIQEKGALQVTSTPASKIYVDNKFIGETPFPKSEKDQFFTVGEHKLKLVPIDSTLLPYTEKIKINKNILTVVDRIFGKGSTSEGLIINLDKLNNQNIELLVLSTPDQAKVFLDSNPVGITPLLIKNITESDHEISIVKDGYRDKNIKIKTRKEYKLTVYAYLGIKIEETILNPSPTASPSAILLPASKVLILETPTGFLNVRTESSLTGSIITKVLPGEEYEIVSEKENWFEIKLKDGKTGWVSSTYAEKQTP